MVSMLFGKTLPASEFMRMARVVAALVARLHYVLASVAVEQCSITNDQLSGWCASRLSSRGCLRSWRVW